MSTQNRHFDLVSHNASFPVTSMVTAMSDLEGFYFIFYGN